MTVPGKKKLRCKRITLVLLACLAVALARPVYHVASNYWRDSQRLDETPTGFVDDASRMNATRIARTWDIPEEPSAAEAQLAELLRLAQAEGLRVSIAGARHTMGGHTSYPGGIAINMLLFNQMNLDPRADILHVQAGARWSDIIPYLDQHGRSVAIMQSNNSFTVGGSISANCHGWQYAKPPIASSVIALRLMRADGQIVRCSRKENAELFRLVLGGYGLFGIILDVDLAVVPNERYRLEQFVVPANKALELYDEKIAGRPEQRMVYGRMNVGKAHFLQEMIINVLHVDEGGNIPSLAEPGLTALRRTIFRGSAESEYGKQFRWYSEVKLQPYLTSRIFSRNQLLNEGVELFQNRSPETTDILHEYFLPREHLTEFVAAMRQIIPQHQGNLLNVTVRHVLPDEDSFLRYADAEMFALVLLFHQPRTMAGDEAMQAMTEELIEAALQAGGRYYLPYRLHATTAQFHRAYPQGREFFDLKRKYDPGELFQNHFYLKYGRS